MANVCIVTMQITGTNASIESVLKEMFDRDTTKLFPRTDIVMQKDEALMNMKRQGGISTFTVFGQCDWAMDYCLLNTKYTREDPYEYPSLMEYTKKHELIIEIFAVEGSLHEHGIVSFGEISFYDCYETRAYGDREEVMQEMEMEFQKKYQAFHGKEFNHTENEKREHKKSLSGRNGDMEKTRTVCR